MSFPTFAHWPPPTGLTTILVPRNSTTFTVSAITTINAPASLVFNTIRNTTAYPDWNTFTPAAVITASTNSSPVANASSTGLLSLGDDFTYTVVLDPAHPRNTTPSFEHVNDISTPEHPTTYVPCALLESDGSFWGNLSQVYRAAWGDVNPATRGQLVTERFSEVVDFGNETSGYRTWENQGGPEVRGYGEGFEEGE
ncbi:hypothetical protein G7Y79_00050g086080 [Physcia stellaris]|nr:hypothetical protein G7Y79_00050g086080 [Physcia stellaris]